MKLKPFDAISTVAKFMLNDTKCLHLLCSSKSLLFTGNYIQEQSCDIPNDG